MWRSLLFLTITLCLSEAALRQRKPCMNGVPEGDKCFCVDGWTGVHCHRKMYCEGVERHENGSCIQCRKGWQGPDCDAIDCNDHGTANYDETECECEKPYSGQFCEGFKTGDIYSYYNNFASRVGALGILTCVPLLIIYMSCEKCARTRQQRRVENHLTGTMVTAKPLSSDAVAQLLDKEEEE